MTTHDTTADLAEVVSRGMERHLAGIEEALAYGGGTHTVEDVIDQLLAGDAQIWEAPGACIITEVLAAPRLKFVHFWLATGEMDALIQLSRRVFEWAEGLGCTQATITGRKGWERALAKEGWGSPLVMLSRELRDG